MLIVVLHVYHSLFIHSYTDGHLGCFYFWGILVNAAMKLSLHIHLQGFAFNFLGYVPRGVIVGLYCNSAVYKDFTNSLTSCASSAHVCVCTSMQVHMYVLWLVKHVYDVHGMITLLLSTCFLRRGFLIGLIVRIHLSLPHQI